MDTLQCDACEIWIHHKCSKLSKEQIEMIDQLDGVVKWYCGECKEKVSILIDKGKKSNHRKEKESGQDIIYCIQYNVLYKQSTYQLLQIDKSYNFFIVIL